MTELSSERLFDNLKMPRSVVNGDSEMELFSRDEEPEETEEDQETFYKKESEMSEEECEKVNELKLEPCKESESQQKDSKGGNQSDPDVKPTHSYIALIAMAILSCPNKKMILGDIYQYISDNFPYYRNKDKSWRNSIRHNLSLNECFIKAGRSENGKGNYWAIHPANLEDFANGDFRRRRARRRVRRSNPLKFGGTVTQSAYIRGLTSLSPHASYLPYRTDEYRVYPGLTYIPPTKKSFAIDSIITGSYDSSLLYSPSSLRSYSSVGLHGAGLDNTVSTGSPSSHLLLHSSPVLGSYAIEAGRSSNPGGHSSYLNPSAFTAYLAPRAALTRIGSRHESWQETLSKLQEQLRKVTP